jgi:hypothetical protein
VPFQWQFFRSLFRPLEGYGFYAVRNQSRISTALAAEGYAFA